jgi:hypothetical protein
MKINCIETTIIEKKITITIKNENLNKILNNGDD